MLGRTQKLLLGLAILLLVNVLWVSSSELSKVYIEETHENLNYSNKKLHLTQILYEDDTYNKPFFSTYFKTSMFSFYLLIIGIIAPWKESCERQHGNYAVCIADRCPINHTNLFKIPHLDDGTECR